MEKVNTTKRLASLRDFMKQHKLDIYGTLPSYRTHASLPDLTQLCHPRMVTSRNISLLAMLEEVCLRD
jgi:hypothetical protein